MSSTGDAMAPMVPDRPAFNAMVRTAPSTAGLPERDSPVSSPPASRTSRRSA